MGDDKKNRRNAQDAVLDIPMLTPEDALGKLEAPTFRPIRWAVAIVVAAASIAVLALGGMFNVQAPSLILELGILLTAGFTLQVLVGWAERSAERRLSRDRERLRTLWTQQRTQLQEVATRDELTQLQNRRFYYERLSAELERAETGKKALSILMIDVDDLKAINDEFGHQVGDIVLRSFARILNSFSDETHMTARLGGDEFAVIMPGSDRRDADELTQRIWRQLAEAPIYETEHASIYLGVSIGSSGYPWGGANVEEITHWADTKLYANKLERKGVARGGGDQRDDRLVAAVVEVLSTALDVRDRMTHRHARRVGRTAAAVARAMPLPMDDVAEIEYAAALHDIGKIGVADSILRKSAALDEDEWKEMRRHSELGYQILKGIDFFKNTAEIVYAHHERFDGSGYPAALYAMRFRWAPVYSRSLTRTTR